MRLQGAHDERLGRLPTAIQIQGAHECLVDVFERGVHATRAGAALGWAKDDELVDAAFATDLGKRGTRDERYLEARQAPRRNRCRCGTVHRPPRSPGWSRPKTQGAHRKPTPAHPPRRTDGSKPRATVFCLKTRGRKSARHPRPTWRTPRPLTPPRADSMASTASATELMDMSTVVGDFEIELVLHGGHELQAVKRVGVQIVKRGRLGKLIELNAEDVRRDVDDLVVNLSAIPRHEKAPSASRLEAVRPRQRLHIPRYFTH